MAHTRTGSTLDQVKEPHSVSLKVLRLSRPSLAIQHPLPLSTPNSSPGHPPASASLAYPNPKADAFILSPLLTLPPAFGSAYVGETFSCTLCANNEVLLGAGKGKVMHTVRIEAEMKIPSSREPIPLTLAPEATVSHPASSLPSPRSPREPGGTVTGEGEKGLGKEQGVDLDPGMSLQKVVNFDLKEEGSHVLAVTITYSETGPTSGRVRTFRKLYQFVCKSCMVVRTKTGALPSSSSSSSPRDEAEGEEALDEKPGRTRARGRKWALEAQLENTGEEIITLSDVILENCEGFNAQGINWESQECERPVLTPGDVQQVCFLVEEVIDGQGRGAEPIDGRLVFGILTIGWRGAMGNRGQLSTGALGTRLK